MTDNEARGLLTRYADGVLEPTAARELEARLERSAELKGELLRIQEENALLREALAPLKPSKSSRMRLVDAMADAHRRATHAAEALPERGWRIARLCFALLALAGACLIAWKVPPVMSAVGAGFNLTLVGLLFGLGLFFVLCGNALAKVEAMLLRRGGHSPLGVLTMQVFGMFAVAAAFALYFLTLRGAF